jgi:hypothetical protein
VAQLCQEMDAKGQEMGLSIRALLETAPEAEEEVVEDAE